MMIRIIICVALLGCGVFTSAAPVRADEYPSRPIAIIVPYPPGGPTDEAARLVASSLSKQFNKNVVVENVTGGGTLIATNKVVKAEPDGYTLLLPNLQISANPSLYKQLPFDTAKDLKPIILINRNPLLLVGRKSLEPKNLSELLATMKTKSLKAAIAGYGTTGHLATVMLEQESHTRLDLIPYRGGAPIVTDLIGEHIDLFFGTPQQLLPQVKAGNMKAYGVTSKEALPELPNASSFVTLFGPKLRIYYWQALFAPAGTPMPVLAKLNAAVANMLEDPAILNLWAKEGVSAFPKDQRSIEAAEIFFSSEITRWGKLIRENNIKIEQ
jgi:putative tricarboxylic transport membrane protein